MINYYDSQRDPANGNTILDTYLWQSVSFSGSTSGFWPDLIVPNPNFPQSTAIRYMIDLPGEPDYSNIDIGNSTFTVLNINTTVTLTRVGYASVLTANTYKIFPSIAERRACLEIHVGTGSNSVGDRLSFQGRFITSGINASNLNELIDYSILKTPIEGFSISNENSTSPYGLTISDGIWHSTNGFKFSFSEITKDISSTFSAGDGNGFLIDSTALTVDEDYYIYVIGDRSITSESDFCCSTNSTIRNGVVPSFPSSYTDYRLIGICQTSTDGILYQGKWTRKDNELRFRYITPISDVAYGASTASTRSLFDITAPIGSWADLNLMIFSNFGTYASVYCSYGETYLTDLAQTSGDIADIFLYYNAGGSNRQHAHLDKEIQIDENKQIFYRAAWGDGTLNRRIKNFGWTKNLLEKDL